MDLFSRTNLKDKAIKEKNFAQSDRIRRRLKTFNPVVMVELHTKHV
jgi:cysteinyl-tRNA synthetase